MGPQDGWKRIADFDWKLEELRSILAQARRQYDQAKIEYDKALETASNVGGYSNPDGGASLRKALENYSSCARRYSTALHDYSAFILENSD